MTEVLGHNHQEKQCTKNANNSEFSYCLLHTISENKKKILKWGPLLFKNESSFLT
jgi:hypothetical protein